MQAVTLENAAADLPGLIGRILANAEATIVVTESGEQVVVMPIDEFNSWRETHYHLASPANAAHLRRSIAEVEAGDDLERELAAE